MQILFKTNLSFFDKQVITSRKIETQIKKIIIVSRPFAKTFKNVFMEPIFFPPSNQNYCYYIPLLGRFYKLKHSLPSHITPQYGNPKNTSQNSAFKDKKWSVQRNKNTRQDFMQSGKLSDEDNKQASSAAHHNIHRAARQQLAYKNDAENPDAFFSTPLSNGFFITPGVVAANAKPEKVSNSKALFLDLKLLRDTICPKNATSESAFKFCLNGREVPFDIKKFLCRLYCLLKTKNITLFEFKLIGSALQRILCRKDKKLGGDIDFLGHLKQVNGKNVDLHDFLDVFTQVLEEQLIIPTQPIPEKNNPSSNYADRLKQLRRKPYVLKAFSYNENFVIVTIPLQLKNSNHQNKKIFIDIDIRINFKREPSCIGSVGFEYDLLQLVRRVQPNQIAVTAGLGYENSVQEAFELLQKGLFFVNEQTVPFTTNGLRSYVTLLVKGLFPIDYHSARAYFIKWKKECESEESLQLGVNEFFNRLKSFMLRHYSINGVIDNFALSLYLINLRTLFACQDWSDQQWDYSKDTFLKEFDEKMACLTNMNYEYLITIKLIVFWHTARQPREMFLIPNSPDLFAIRSNCGDYGMLSETPWEETYRCDWTQLEKKLKGMHSFLKTMGVPSNLDELKCAIASSLQNHHNPHISTPASRSTLSAEALQKQKILRLAFQPTFDYALFFSIFLEIIRQSPDSQTRATNLRDFINFIQIHHPKCQFRNLLAATNENDPSLFGAIALDLRESENGQEALCECISRPYCQPYINEILPLIFSYINPKFCERYFGYLWTAQERNQRNVSSLVFYQLLTMALTSPEHLKAWNKVFLQRLPLVLEEAHAHGLPPDLLNAIGLFFDRHQEISPNIFVNALLNLSQLGYDKKKIKVSLESCLKQHHSNNPHDYTKVLNSGLFTPQALWELVGGEFFNLEQTPFLQSLSLQCWQHDTTPIPILEQYWIKAMRQNVLPLKLLNKIEALLNITNRFKQHLRIAKKPSSQFYEARLASLFNRRPLPDPESSLEEFYKHVRETFAFDRHAFTANDWEKLFNLIEPGLKTAPPQIFIPILAEMLGVIPEKQIFINFFTPLKDPLLAKIRSYISDTPLLEGWEKIHSFAPHYWNCFPLDDEDEDPLLEAILTKIDQHPIKKESIKISTTLIKLEQLITLAGFNQQLNAFHYMMAAESSLFESKDAALLWGELVSSLSQLIEKEDEIDLSTLTIWVNSLYTHFSNFENISIPLQAMKKFASICRTENCTYAQLCLENLKKLSNETQINNIPSLTRDWNKLWKEVLGLPLTLEHCFELYKIFRNMRGYTVIPNKEKKVELFCCLQHKIFTSTLAINSVFLNKININQKEQLQLCETQYFHYIDLFHKNFLQLYIWIHRGNDKSVIAPMLPQLAENMALHMNMLAEARKIKSDKHIQLFEQHSFELLDFVLKNNLGFLSGQALKFITPIGYISNQTLREKLFLHVVNFAKGMLTPNEENKKPFILYPITGRFNSLNKEDALICTLVMTGIDHLMNSNKIEEANKYFLEMLPQHPSIKGFCAVSSFDEEIKKLISIQQTTQDKQLNKIFMYMQICFDVLEQHGHWTLNERHALVKAGFKLEEYSPFLNSLIKSKDLSEKEKQTTRELANRARLINAKLNPG